MSHFKDQVIEGANRMDEDDSSPSKKMKVKVDEPMNSKYSICVAFVFLCVFCFLLLFYSLRLWIVEYE